MAGSDDGVERLAGVVLAAAQRAVDRGEWDHAAELAQQVLDVVPGHRTAAEVLAVAAERGRLGASDQGRRYLTVLFSDIVGSTPLSDRLDPEDYLGVVAAYRDVVRAAVRRHDGHIDQFQGDGVVAYFGFPSAAEDDQVRAVEAGLEIVAEVPDAGRSLGVDLEARVGVHVGRTVMTSAALGVRDQSSAIGLAANVAAKLQSGAPASTVVVSDSAVDAVTRHFVVERLGDRVVQGGDGAVGVYAVRGRRAETSLVDDQVRAPIIGRAVEQARLEEAWSATGGEGEAGVPRAVLLTGEPGMGKSRLAGHAVAVARAGGGGVIEIDCRQGLRRLSLGAVRRSVEKLFGLPTAAPVDRVGAALRERGLLLGVPIPTVAVLESVLGDAPAAELAPDLLRESVLDALVEWVTAEAAARRTLLVVEDVHWADDTTVEVLRRVVTGRVPDGLLVVVTARTGMLPGPLTPLERDAIALGPLGAAEAVELVRTLASGSAVPVDELPALAERSEGVPLFAEHLVVAAAGGVDATLPSTLEGLLQVRLDATGNGRGAAEIASLFGREFTAELVHLACEDLGGAGPVHPHDVDAALRELQRAGLVEPHEAGGLRFRHSLVRDAAYELQLRADRARRHAAAARALRASLGPHVPAGVLAYHHEQAGDPEAAAAAHLQAARDAAGLAEYDLALVHLRSARGLVDAVEGLSGWRLELDWCMQLGAVSMVSSAWASTEVREAAHRALELCDLLTETTGPTRETDLEVAAALAALWIQATVSGDIPAARSVTDRVEKMAAVAPPDLSAEFGTFVLVGRGIELFFSGANDEVIATLSGLEVGERYWVALEHRTPHEPATATVAIYAAALALRGDDVGANEALARSFEACRHLPFPMGPFTEDLVLIYSSLVHRFAGKLDEAAADAARIVANGERHGFREHVMLGHMLGFCAGALRGDLGACHALRSSLQMWASVGGGLGVPLFLAELAAGFLLADEIGLARDAVDEALAVQEPSGQRVAEPELRRLAALVAHAEGAPVDGVVDALLGAAELAAARGAHRYAARALVDVSRVTGGAPPDAARALTDRVLAAVPSLTREVAGS